MLLGVFLVFLNTPEALPFRAQVPVWDLPSLFTYCLNSRTHLLHHFLIPLLQFLFCSLPIVTFRLSIFRLRPLYLLPLPLLLLICEILVMIRLSSGRYHRQIAHNTLLFSVHFIPTCLVALDLFITQSSKKFRFKKVS